MTHNKIDAEVGRMDAEKMAEEVKARISKEKETAKEIDNSEFKEACWIMLEHKFNLYPNPKEVNFVICSAKGLHFRLTLNEDNEPMIEEMAYVKNESRWCPLQTARMPEKKKFNEFFLKFLGK